MTARSIRTRCPIRRWRAPLSACVLLLCAQRGLECPLWRCAVERRRFSVGESPTRRDAPAGSNRSSCGGNEAAEAFGDKRVTIYGDVASVQAVTRVNAEQASKRTMRGPIRPSYRRRLTWVGEQEQKR